MTHEFFNEWHLGDCLFQCLYFQRVAPLRPEDTFVLYSHYAEQLLETVVHLPNVRLMPLDARPASAINCWIGAGQYWHTSPIRNDYLLFYLEWFKLMSQAARLPCPFKIKDDFWFDYPALKNETCLSQPYDFLVVNAVPKSGQFSYAEGEMDALIGQLVAKGHKVITTNPCQIGSVPCTLSRNLSITGVGNISNYCRYHVMISTGPSWPTFNVANKGKVELRLVMLNNIHLDYDAACVHVGYVQGALNVLRSRNLL